MSTILMSSNLFEKRPLKKSRLGPPDVYPQDPKQREDDLTATNVKQGYSNNLIVQDEYGSARNSNITLNRINENLCSILAKKLELNTFPDTSRKKQQISKDSTLYVTSKNKSTVDSWFRDLASNNRSLTWLARKVPFFHKKEDVFTQLCEFNVPTFRAIWFVKMSCAHQMAVTESNIKTKKRQLPDPSLEWTACLCKFVKDHFDKICSSLNGTANITNPLQMNAPQPPGTEDLLKQWNYYGDLCQALYEEHLLERMEYLYWLLEIFEKIKSVDDPALGLILPMVLQYIDEYVQSEEMSRRLGYYCCKKINQIVFDFNVELHSADSEKENSTTNSSSEKPGSTHSTPTKSNHGAETNCNMILQNGTINANALALCFKEITACSKFRTIMYNLCTMIQIIILECPASMVWLKPQNSDENNTKLQPSPQSGSPLDYLPCEPSNLPMPVSEKNDTLRKKIKTAEDLIRHRSVNAEKRWSFHSIDQKNTKSIGNVLNRQMNMLEFLDKYLNYFEVRPLTDGLKTVNPFDVIYRRVFYPDSKEDESEESSTKNPKKLKTQTLTLQESIAEDATTVRLLCEWVVTTKRLGEYRAKLVAKLLEKRQNELTEKMEELNEIKNGDAENGEKPDVPNSSASASLNNNDPFPIYQNILFEYLDNYAPVYDDKNQGMFGPGAFSSVEHKQAFHNLILLFSELIRSEIFSHDSYMCTLISRGLILNPPNLSLGTSNNNQGKSGNDDGFMETNNSLLASSLNKSNSSSSLPLFDPFSNNTNMNHSMLNNQDDHNIDDDLDQLLQNIKAGQSNDQTDAMESDKEDDAPGLIGGTSSTNPTSLSDLPVVSKTAVNPEIKATQRHFLYALHFPLPQDSFFEHEINQRFMLLYGVGRAKDDARHSVKKVNKEIMKLFSRKTSMDISDRCKIRKSIMKENFDFGNAISKFQTLPIFDQQCITSTCAATVLEMLRSVANGTGNHIPLIESVAFLFDLMEIALNVYGLIEFIVQMVRELPLVDTQLQQKCSMVGRQYGTAIGLYIVGILYRYHNYLVVSNEDVLNVFDALCKLVRQVENPRDCSSAERCIFFYINDLYLSCSFLLKKHHDSLAPILTMASFSFKDKEPETISVSNPYNSSIMMQYLKNPKLKVDPNHIRQLNESAEERYCFVFNAIVCTAETIDMDHLNDMSVLCAELTASCPNLSSEWINAFKVLCNCLKKNDYSKLLSHIKISDRSIYDNLAVFLLILVARRCFRLDEFIPICVSGSIVPTLENMNTTSAEPEPFSRLCCHLLLHLFKYYDSPLAASTSSNVNSLFTASSRYSLTSPGPLGLSTMMQTNKTGSKAPFAIKYACDRYLLGGALNSLKIQLIITTMKAIFVLSTQLERKEGKSIFKPEKPEMGIDDFMKQRSGESSFGDMSFLHKSSMDTMDKQSLAEFAKQVLKQICSQDWVHDRCIRCFMDEPEKSIKGLMFDKRLSHKDAQHLLNMICYQKQMLQPALVSDKNDFKNTITQIFQNFDEWSLRISLLQLTLIYEQMKTSTSYSSKDVAIWLETLANFIVDYFLKVSQNEPILDYKQLTLFTSKSTVLQSNSAYVGNNVQSNNERVWLIAALVSKLPSALQNELLKTTAKEMDSQQWVCYFQPQSSSISSKNKTNFQPPKSQNQNQLSINDQNSTSVLLSYQPFITLLQLCMAQKDGQKESILNSLYNQIFQCKNEKVGEDVRIRKAIQSGLQLRLSLVGAMFEVITSSNSFTNDWAVLFLQLISYTIVDPQIHYENFVTILDMLNALIHSAQVVSSLSEQQAAQREDSKRITGNIIKKLRKELNQERLSLGLKMLKQLLPLPKLHGEVIQCQPIGTLVDTKGNKITGFDPVDKKHGLQVSEKQKFSPWDLLEGNKLQAPLSFTWFGGVKVEKKPMRMEENFVLLNRHSHSLHKPNSYYLEGPPLPPEDEPAPQPPPIQPQQPSQLNMMLSNLSGPPSVGPPPQSFNMGSGPMTPGSVGPPIVPNSPMFQNIPNAGSNFNNPPQLMNQMANNPPPPQMQPSSMVGGPPPGPPGGPGNFPPHLNQLGGPPSQMQSHGMGNPGGPPGMMDGPIGQMSGPPPQAPPQHQPSHPQQQQLMGGMIGGMPGMNPNSQMMGGMMERNDMMMDTVPPPPNQMHIPPPMLRPPMVMQQPTPLPTTLPSPRAPQPKIPKAKAPRRKRANAKNQSNPTPPLTGQQTPPIRMAQPAGFNDQFNQGGMNPQQGNWNNYPPQQQQQPPQQPPQQAMSQAQPPQQGGFGGFSANNPNQMQQTPQPMMNNPGPPATRYQEPKARLRAMLNTRHPNPNNQMMNQQPNPGMQMAGQQMYAQRQMQPQMMQRPPMRQQAPPQQPQQQPNQMFQQQQQQPQPPPQQQQQPPPQQTNFGQNMNFVNNQMDNSNFGNAAPNQNMMMRPQMAQQQPNNQQFMQQRSQQFQQMNQPNPMNNFGNQQNPSMNQSGQMGMSQAPGNWNQNPQINAPRAISQLQRQLSSNPQQPPYQYQ